MNKIFPKPPKPIYLSAETMPVPAQDANKIEEANKVLAEERRILSGGRDANILFGSVGGREAGIYRNKLFGSV
jgi:hypothetical protein